MQSDDRLVAALDALTERRELYRRALREALERMRDYRLRHSARAQGSAAAAAQELGRFAGGRLDSERFAAVFTTDQLLSPTAIERIERCESVLVELLGCGDTLFQCGVPAGTSMREAVEDALADLGRAFGAALAFQAARAGVYRPEQHDAYLRRFPFMLWNQAERLLAPPLVVSVEGAVLHAEQLVPYLDGGVRIALVAPDASSAAPLVRLISPNVLVAQGSDQGIFGVLEGSQGPAAVALLPATAARFVHDPRNGKALSDRLRVDHLPAEPTSRPAAARVPWSAREELGQLAAIADLATRAAAPPMLVHADEAAAAPQSGGTPTVDAVAAWLLSEAGLPGAAGVAS